ncbi:hypothetical protein EDC96DRAFT_546825 [Choanephora cucurbitarum]|nr:hypothetical protein EDC96DRAFT_546825 [Choanephora cucurbitarum]
MQYCKRLAKALTTGSKACNLTKQILLVLLKMIEFLTLILSLANAYLYISCIHISKNVCDIICDPDCDGQLLTNKQTTEQYSFAVSNASYRLRSGMSWIQQKESKSRILSSIQTSYDSLQSRKIQGQHHRAYKWQFGRNVDSISGRLGSMKVSRRKKGGSLI